MIQFDETGQAVAFLADALKSLRSRAAIYGPLWLVRRLLRIYMPKH